MSSGITKLLKIEAGVYIKHIRYSSCTMINKFSCMVENFRYKLDNEMKIIIMTLPKYLMKGLYNFGIQVWNIS